MNIIGKYLVLLLCAVFAQMFVGNVFAQSELPVYSCDFENATENSNWVFVNGDQTNKWFIGTVANNGGSNGLYISNDDGASNAYTNDATTYVYAYREITFENAGDYIFTFDWQCFGESYYDYLRVFLVPDNISFMEGSTNDISYNDCPEGWKALDDNIKLNQNSSWSTNAITTFIPVGTYKLVFYWKNDGSSGEQPPAAVDNISISFIIPPVPECTTLVSPVENVSVNTVYPKLQWNAEENASGYKIYWSTTNSMPATPNATVTGKQTTSYTLTQVQSLSDNTAYYWWVVPYNYSGEPTDCASGVFNVQVPEPATIPYSCDFEDSDINYGWILENGNQTNKWHIGTATNNGGEKSLYVSYNDGVSNMYDGSSESYVYAYRRITFDYADRYKISYDWQADGERYYDYLRVFLVPDYVSLPAFLSVESENRVSYDYIPDGWIALDNNSQLYGNYSWKTESLFVNVTAGTYKLVVFWKNDHSSGNQPPAAVDNISIIPFASIPAPDCVSLTSPTAEVQTLNPTLEWTANSDAIGYKIYWSTTSTMPTTPNATINDAQTTSYTLSIEETLENNTTYYWWVVPFNYIESASNCSPESFTTNANTNTVSDIPYSCNFEDATEISNWILENGEQTNKWYIGTATNNGGANGLYISNDDGTSNAYSINGSASYVYAYRVINFTLSDDYIISFDWQANGESIYDYLRAFLVPNNVTLEAGESSNISPSVCPSGWIALDNRSKLNQNSSWSTKTITTYVSAGTYKLVFFWKNDGGGGENPPAAIDNISIRYPEIPNCVTLVSPVLEARSLNPTFEWTADENAKGYEIYWSTTSTMPTTSNATINDAQTTSYTLSIEETLENNTTYYWWVVPFNSAGSASDCSPEMFVAYNNIVSYIPYSCDFEDDETENWNFVNGTQVNKWFIGSAANNGGDNSLYISNNAGRSNVYNVENESYVFAYCSLFFEERASYFVSFDWRAFGESDYDYLRAFLVPDNVVLEDYFYNISYNDCLEGWIALDDSIKLNQNSSWSTKTITTFIPMGTYKLVFYWKNDGSYGEQPPAAVDNITIKKIPTDNDILAYTHQGFGNVVIDSENHTVVCEARSDLDLSSVAPTITVSEGAAIFPESGVMVNLSSPRYYWVTSELGETQLWTVTASNLPISSLAEITNLTFPGQLSLDIDSENANITSTISHQYEITNIVPEFEISYFATMDYQNGTAIDFTSPLSLTVTAQDGTAKDWTISVSHADSPEGDDCTNPYIVDASTDLPYTDNNTTNDKHNIFGKYFADEPSRTIELSGNDVTYRLNVENRMLVNVSANATNNFSIFVLRDCSTGNSSVIASQISVQNANMTNIDLQAGSYYIIIDGENNIGDYSLQITSEYYCYPVDEIVATNITQSEISLAWTSHEDVSQWNLRYGSAEFILETEGTLVENLTSPNHTITGLDTSTEYDFYVQTVCGGKACEWSLITVSTISDCQKPDAIVVENYTNSEISLSWNGYNMTAWIVEYKTESETEYNSINNIGEANYVISELSANTTYNIRIKADCGEGTYSDYEYIDVTTTCESLTEFPYLEEFDSEIFPMECWSQERTVAGSGAGINYVNGAWMRTTNAVGENSTSKAMLADTKAGSVHNLVTRPLSFEQTNNGYNISLDVYRSANSVAAATNEGVEIWVNNTYNLTSGTPEMLGFISKNYTVSDGNIVNAEETAGWYSYKFNTNRTGLCYVILVGKSQYAGGVYIDNLLVDKEVECYSPENVELADLGRNDITVSWNGIGETESWNVEYSLNGGEMQTANVSTPELQISDLEANTSYEITVRIQSVCAEELTSDWKTETFTVITDCGIYDLPLSENFENSTDIPDCWGADENLWTVSENSAYLASRNENSATILATPMLNFEPEKSYLLDFDVYRTFMSLENPDVLTVYVNTTASLEGATRIDSVQMQNAPTSGMENQKFSLPNLSGEYCVMFVANGYREYKLDNILVRAKSSDAYFLTFDFAEQTSEAVIDTVNKTVNIEVEHGAELSSLTPAFTYSEGATIDYESGITRDFTSAVHYNIVSEDGEVSNDWTVNVARETCPNPTENNINIIVDGGTATFEISRINLEEAYNIKISAQQINPSTEIAEISDTTINANESLTIFAVSSLEPLTQYYAYVQSSCNENWTELAFMSGCAVYELPYSEDFTNGTELDCWTIIDANNDNKTWTIANGSARYIYSQVNQANDYLTSPQIAVEPNAKISFDYYVGDFSYPEAFSVFVLTNNDTVLLNSLTVNNEEARTFGPFDISEYAGEVVRIAIKCESAPYSYRLYIDNFNVLLYGNTIYASAVGRGNISPEGQIPVVAGESVDFAMTAEYGNELISLFVDDTDVTAEVENGTYRLNEIAENHRVVATFSDLYYVRTFAGEHGMIEPEGENFVTGGEDFSLVIIPDNGYEISEVLVDGADVSAEMSSNIYTLENVVADHEISVSFSEIIYYTVTATAGENGNISPSGESRLEAGENISFTITPDNGFGISTFTVDEVDAMNMLVDNVYVIENISSNHTISVTFEEIPVFTISASNGENGTITPSGEISVSENGSQSFEIVANEGYHISSVIVDEAEVISQIENGVYTFENVNSDHTIHAEFAINTYSIISYASGGTISPSGTIEVNHGENISFEFTPNEDYEFSYLLVDNVVTEPDGNTFTLENVSGNHVVVVVFVPTNVVLHTIISTAGEHGTISPNGSINVVEGENQQYVITADEHYYISALLVDGDSVEIVETYEFENVTEAHSIEARFEAYKHTITATAGDHGAINPAGETEVDEGSDMTFAFVPDAGYRVAQVLVDGVDVEFADDSYTFENVLEDHTIEVSFEMLPLWTITAAAGNNGTISPNGTQYLVEGDNMEFTFTPNEGYMIDRLFVDSRQLSIEGNTYVFENVTEDHYIYVSFRPLAFVITATAGENGIITPSGETEVLQGGEQTFTLIPDIGYMVDSVFVDDEYVEVLNNMFTFTDVQSAHAIHATFRHISVAIDEVAVGEVSLYPNPNNGNFTLELVGVNAQEYAIYDISGRIIESNAVSSPVINFDMQLSTGTYFIRITAGKEVITRKIVIE